MIRDYTSPTTQAGVSFRGTMCSEELSAKLCGRIDSSQSSSLPIHLSISPSLHPSIDLLSSSHTHSLTYIHQHSTTLSKRTRFRRPGPGPGLRKKTISSSELSLSLSSRTGSSLLAAAQRGAGVISIHLSGQRPRSRSSLDPFIHDPSSVRPGLFLL